MPDETAVPLWLCLSVTALSIAPLDRPNGGPAFRDPLWTVALLYIAYFPLRAAFLWYLPNYTFDVHSAQSSFERQCVRGLQLVALAGCAMHWGGRLPSFQVRPRSSLDMEPGESLVYGWMAMGFAGLVLRAGFIFFPGVAAFRLNASTGSVLGYALDCGVVAAAAAFTCARTAGQRKAAWALIGCDLVAMFGYGFKEPPIMLLFFILAGRRFQGKRISWGRVGLAVCISVFGVFPLIEAKRMADADGEGLKLSNIENFFETSAGRSMDTDLTDKAMFGLAHVSERLHGMDSLCLILQRVPDSVPHTGVMEPAGRFLWTFVPRPFYSAKPVIHQSSVVNRVFVGHDNGTAIAIFQLAEAYYIVGVPGIVALALFTGWSAQLIANSRNRLRTLRFFPYFCLSLWTVMSIERDWVLVWTTFPRELAVFAVISWLCGSHSSRRVPRRDGMLGRGYGVAELAGEAGR
jgi:hypothetical protein